MRMRRMRRRSVAAVTKILQEDRDDGEEYESPDEKVEECVSVHAIVSPSEAKPQNPNCVCTSQTVEP
jgi:hypothetical protein